jgi:hypothetical protein
MTPSITVCQYYTVSYSHQTSNYLTPKYQQLLLQIHQPTRCIIALDRAFVEQYGLTKDVYAIKREDGGPGRSLENDFIIHRKVLTAMTCITVPNCYQYISASDAWWGEHLCEFPKGYQACNAFISERIPPFPNEARTRIIDTYCPEFLRAGIKLSEPDRDCLIRP